jgi:hypothetical protein
MCPHDTHAAAAAAADLITPAAATLMSAGSQQQLCSVMLWQLQLPRGRQMQQLQWVQQSWKQLLYSPRSDLSEACVGP